MTAVVDCTFCGQQPERIEGRSSLVGQWHQVRCHNPKCVEHGTVRHVTANRAASLWNVRQSQHKNIMKNAATAATNKD